MTKEAEQEHMPWRATFSGYRFRQGDECLIVTSSPEMELQVVIKRRFARQRWWWLIVGAADYLPLGTCSRALAQFTVENKFDQRLSEWQVCDASQLAKFWWPR